MKIRKNVKISDLVTMKIGGKTRWVFELETLDDIADLVPELARHDIGKWFFLGGGANSFAVDEEFDGAIILNRIKDEINITNYSGDKSGLFEDEQKPFLEKAIPGGYKKALKILEEKEFLGPLKGYYIASVTSGMNWDKFVDFTVENGFTGVECLAGIPGTVGAAPVQNIGAYGQEVASTIRRVDVLDMRLDEAYPLPAEKCKFSYRRSIFNSEEHRGRFFIGRVYFALKRGKYTGEFYKSLVPALNMRFLYGLSKDETAKELEKGNTEKYLDTSKFSKEELKKFDDVAREPKNIAETVRLVRDSKLPNPDKIASSGSYFKNIYVGEDKIKELDEKGIPHHGTKINTAWLIEQTGLKGKTFHGFKVSETAPLVLENISGKSYGNLWLATKEISDAVYKKFGFKLEREPNLISNAIEDHDLVEVQFGYDW